MELSEEDVLEILKLFEQSKSISFSSSRASAGSRSARAAMCRPQPAARARQHHRHPVLHQPVPPRPMRLASVQQPRGRSPPPVVSPLGLVAVTAPMVGKFYSAPAPSDPPYVEVGSKVLWLARPSG